jgi:ABC-type Fe3+-hydroxamate transport system substrate-binding protein
MMIDEQNISADTIYSRMVSLVPSQTELLYDLGLEEEVVGITKFCVHPAKLNKTKARIGGTKNVNIAAIHRIQPNLIIANKEENVKEQVEELAQTFDVLVTDVNNLQDALAMIRTIGQITGKQARAMSLADAINQAFDKLILAIDSKRKIKTAYLIWKNPYMAAGGGTFINNMTQHCGMVNIFTNVNRYPKISLDELRDCELILLSSEPYPFKEKHADEIRAAIPNARIILADGEMFSWYGSRLLKAAHYFENLHKKILTQYPELS